MEVIENTAVQTLLPSSVVNRAAHYIDRFEILEDAERFKKVIYYWGLKESVILSSIIDEELAKPQNYNLPSPIMRDYDWPGIYKPFEHQKTTAAFLSIRKRAFCFNQMGTGKTSSAIWAADYLMREKVINRVLIVCPLSIMHTAWQGDVFNTAMHRSCAIAHGSAEKRKKIINGEYEFVIINFDGLAVVADEVAKGGFNLIIVDEASAYKSTTTKRWKTLSKLISSSTWLWMMTGTPAAQSPVDAFGLAKLVAPHRVPKFVTAWKDRVMTNISRFNWIPKPNAKDHVFLALQPAIRFTKEECLDLPDVTYQTRDVPLTPQAATYYKKLKKQMIIEAAGEQISAVNAAASLTKLLQISGGAVYTDKREIVEFDITPRLKELQEVLDETCNKVVVFVPYTHTIDVVKQYLTSKHISNEVIQGAVTPIQRSEIIKRFQQQKDPHVLVIQPQAASHGITLTAADTVVFWSPVMSVEVYLQCIGRIDRVGQKNKMTVVHLQGSDVEKRMYKMLQGKVDSHQKIVDLYRQELDDEEDLV